jgi:selenocysteine lyase/cysteine desulfurase
MTPSLVVCLLFPPIVHAITRLQHGVENILVDGAHAPGSIPLDIPSIGADYYVGNLHKCASVNQSPKR